MCATCSGSVDGRSGGPKRVNEDQTAPAVTMLTHTTPHSHTHTHTHTVNLSGSVYILKKLLTPLHHCGTSELCACYKSL